MVRVDCEEGPGVVIGFEIEALVESDRNHLRDQAEESGYLFFRRLIDPTDIRALRQRALETASELGWLADGCPVEEGVARAGIRLGVYDAPDWIEFQCRMLPTAEFTSLGENPALLRIVEELLGEPPRTRCGDICRVMSPGTPELATVPHQDRYYVRTSDDLWTAWIPLGDCPRELGGLAVLPGSHRRGPLPHFGEGSGRQGVDIPAGIWATADFEAGDVLLFASLTVHRALPNLTPDQIRLSADYRYQPESEPWAGLR